MNKLINPMNIEHIQYEKIVDDVYIIGSNLKLTMNVVLGRKKKDDTKYSYHNEYMYHSDKYNDLSKLITMKRSFDYYFAFENLYAGGFENNIMIRPQDMYSIIYSLEECKRWFFDKEFVNMYAYSKDKLVLVDKPQPIQINNLPGNKTIIIEPTVISYENNQFEGVRLFINDYNNYSDVPVDRLMGLIHLLTNADMYGYAQNMVNYLGRPEVGYNMVEFNNIRDMAQPQPITTGSKGRGVQKKGGSFFDSIDNL